MRFNEISSSSELHSLFKTQRAYGPFNFEMEKGTVGNSNRSFSFNSLDYKARFFLNIFFFLLLSILLLFIISIQYLFFYYYLFLISNL